MEMKEWPDYTCVLTFIYESLKQIGAKVEVEELIPFLNIKVPNGTANPYNFGLTDDENLYGLPYDNINVQLNNILGVYAPEYSFKNYPLNQIPYQLYEEFMRQALAEKIIVGFGYNYSIISGKPKVFKHVSFVKGFEKNKVEVLDFFLDVKGTSFKLDYNIFINSISSINDGFWLIGKEENLKACAI
jgi:hypothetical protein